MSVELHVLGKVCVVGFVSCRHLGVGSRDVRVFEEQVHVMLLNVAANQVIRHCSKPVGVFEGLPPAVRILRDSYAVAAFVNLFVEYVPGIEGDHSAGYA
ncbi:hypothetical protein D3C76_1314400 [compost metagenome]